MASDLTFLVAEDNTDDVLLLREAFKRAGTNCDIRDVQNGEDAMAYLNGDGVYSNRTDHPFPDVVLLDINMPCVNGFEVLEQMRQSPHLNRTVVHVFSASAREVDVKRAYDAKANSYLVKPSGLNELVDMAKTLTSWHQLVMLPPKTSARKTHAAV